MVAQAAVGLYRALGRFGMAQEAVAEAITAREPTATTPLTAEAPEDDSRIPRVPSPSRSLRAEIVTPTSEEAPACSQHHHQSCVYSHDSRRSNTCRQRATPKAKAAAAPVVKDHEEVHFVVRVPIQPDFDRVPEGPGYWCSDYGKRFHRKPDCWGLRTANRVIPILHPRSRPDLTPCKLCARR